ncbi:unnamed protein product, partial [Oppiella nova]
CAAVRSGHLSQQNPVLLLRGAAAEPPRGGRPPGVLLHRSRVRGRPPPRERRRYRTLLYLLRGQERAYITVVYVVPRGAYTLGTDTTIATDPSQSHTSGAEFTISTSIRRVPVLVWWRCISDNCALSLSY